MTFEEQLEAIENAYFDADEENRDDVIDALKTIHKQVLKLKPDDALEYKRELAGACGGLMIPYLFWFELIRFLDQADNSELIQELLAKFATSNFEELEQKYLKPLVAIYFSKETEFQLDKFDSRVVNTAHPEVQQYFRRLLKFVHSTNQASLDAYQQKLSLLKPYYPDFEMFNQPISRLREELGLED